MISFVFETANDKVEIHVYNFIQLMNIFQITCLTCLLFFAEDIGIIIAKLVMLVMERIKLLINEITNFHFFSDETVILLTK